MVRAELIERSKKLQETPPLERLAGMKEMLLKAGDEAQEIPALPGLGLERGGGPGAVSLRPAAGTGGRGPPRQGPD